MKKLLLAILPLLTAGYSYAQNTEWPSTNSNNNVGIGTANPSSKLQVEGAANTFALVNSTLNSGNNSGETNIYMGDASSGVSMLRASKRTINTRAFEIWTEYGFNVPSKSADFFHNGINLYTSDQNRFSIDMNGNVGIGIASPGSKLVVAPSSQEGNIDQTIGIIQNNGTSAFGGYIGQRVVSANTRQGLIVSASASLTLNAAAYNIDFVTGNIEATTDANLAMRIASTGNVGIGTVDPGKYKLAVKGPMHTQSVQVDMTGWSDYVFKPSYSLSPLAAVKSYIDQNHHLPDVPSEDQVKRDGIDLGEMNSKLLKKIEELTLYMIEKDKQVNELQQEVSQIKQQLMGTTSKNSK